MISLEVYQMGKKGAGGNAPILGDSRRRDITGRRVGSLVADHPTQEVDGKNSTIWIWRCDCGAEVRMSVRESWGNRTLCPSCARALKSRQATDMQARVKRVDGTNLSRLGTTNQPQANNTSGHPGVNWHKALNRWQVRIMFRGKSISLGYYSDFGEACRVRDEAWERYHKAYLDESKKEEQI